MSYGEESFYALSSIADSLATMRGPAHGYCKELFLEAEDNLPYVIIGFSPSPVGVWEEEPPVFYALISKGPRRAATIELIDAESDAQAIRKGIAMIDSARASLPVDEEVQGAEIDAEIAF